MVKCGPHQAPLFLMQDALSHYLERQIRRMTYDDALHALWRGYRLEYLTLAGGYPQYRLYRWDQLIGFVDWRSPKRLPEVQMQVACYLAGIGYTKNNTRLIVCGAKTAIDAPTQRLLRLIPVDKCATMETLTNDSSAIESEKYKPQCCRETISI